MGSLVVDLNPCGMEVEIKKKKIHFFSGYFYYIVTFFIISREPFETNKVLRTFALPVSGRRWPANLWRGVREYNTCDGTIVVRVNVFFSFDISVLTKWVCSRRAKYFRNEFTTSFRAKVYSKMYSLYTGKEGIFLFPSPRQLKKKKSSTNAPPRPQ